MCTCFNQCNNVGDDYMCVCLCCGTFFFVAKHAYSNANHGRDFYIVFVADFG